MNRGKLLAFVLGALFCGLATRGFAASFAHFSDGNDDSNGGVNPPTVDSFRGTAGSGWGGAWRANTNFSPAFSANVDNVSPVNGGGNYLKVSLNQTSGNFGQAAVNRQYVAQGGVQLDQSHVISFDFRTDAALVTGSLNDRYQIFDHINGNESATLSQNTWVIAAYGSAAGGPQGVVPGNWGLLNGNVSNNGFTAQQFIDTGFAVTAGATYHMVVTTNPATKTWQASISDGLTTFTSDTLLWRNQTATAAGGYVYWGLQQTAAVGQVAGPYQFSLDNISIAVPEPTAWGLSAPTIGLALASRRRRTRGA